MALGIQSLLVLQAKPVGVFGCKLHKGSLAHSRETTTRGHKRLVHQRPLIQRFAKTRRRKLAGAARLGSPSSAEGGRVPPPPYLETVQNETAKFLGIAPSLPPSWGVTLPNGLTPAEFQGEDADPGFRCVREMVRAGGCLGGARKKHSKTRFFTGFLAAAALPKMCSIQLPKHVKTVQQLQPQGQTRRRRAVTMFGGISGVLL